MSQEDEIKETNKLCDEILELIPDLPEKAEEFGASVEEKTLNIKEWIETNNMVTPAQIKALKNMMKGLSKWFR